MILPPSANTLVPLDFSVPMEANQSAPLRIICGMFAYVSTLLRMVGLLEQTLDCRERRTGTGLAALTLYRGHKSGLLAADERARAEAELNVEIEVGSEDILAQKSVFSCLLQSLSARRWTAIGYSART